MTAVIKGPVIIKVRHGLLKNKTLPGNWGVLFDANGGDNQSARIELYNDKNSPTPALYTLYLEQVKFVDKSFRQQDCTLTLSIKKDKHYLEFDCVDTKIEWVQALCHVSSDLWTQRASSIEHSDSPEDSQDMNVNLLYDTCERVQHFKVSMIQTKASEVNSLQGHYMLNPTKESLRLLDNVSFKCIHEWPYRQIRKYGRTKNVFRIEVGRRCTTGEGEFEFFTPDGPTLTDLITVYTKQVRENDERQRATAEKAAAAEGGAKAQAKMLPLQTDDDIPGSPKPQYSPGPPIPRRQSDSKDSQVVQEGAAVPDTIARPQRGQSVNLPQKNSEPPRPAPRLAVPKQENGIARSPTKPSSSDHKIYETASGLTAPLHPDFKDELHTKLQVQVSDPADGYKVKRQSASSGTIDEDFVSSDAGEARDRTSSEEGLSSRNKKSDKDRKRKEKEEAKLRKQQEKEEKEQREREIKEQKALDKKLKKGKGHSKLFGKKSFDLPQPTPGQGTESNIYDEPGDMGVKAKLSPLSDGTYAEAGIVSVQNPAAQYTGAVCPGPASINPPVEYAIPEKPKKDSWKEHARPETEDLQQENYNSIKLAAQSQPSTPSPPPLPPFLRTGFGRSDRSDEEDDGTYDRLGQFEHLKVADPAAGNHGIYGMASAVPTIPPSRPPPHVPPTNVSSEYEEADVVSAALIPARPPRELKDRYEEPNVQIPQRALVPFKMLDEGDYADVS